jgi:multidrug efflux system membrane fusion protein
MPVEVYDRGDVQKLTTGTLLTADNQIDTTTGTDKLKAVFDNKDQSLFPNQFVNIHLIMENRPNALVVPSAAIQSGLDGSYVWVISKDAKGAQIAKRQVVNIALAEGQLTILDSGVQPAQSVVVDGADRLRQGQVVIATSARQPATQKSGNSAGQASGSAPALFATPASTAGQGSASGAGSSGGGKGTGNHHKKEQQ